MFFVFEKYILHYILFLCLILGQSQQRHRDKNCLTINKRLKGTAIEQVHRHESVIKQTK